MRLIAFALAATWLGLSAVSAAELAVPQSHPRMVIHHRHVRHAGGTHFGYYWYHWGFRHGGTARSWYGSSFVFIEPWWW